MPTVCSSQFTCLSWCICLAAVFALKKKIISDYRVSILILTTAVAFDANMAAGVSTAK